MATTEKKLLSEINDEISRLTVNRYQRHLPYAGICGMLEEEGLYPTDPDEVPFILSGKEGTITVEFKHADFPKRHFYLHLSWHQMDSGNYEAVSYVDATNK